MNYSASINGDGTRIIFTSDQDLTGANQDHNQEIFLFDTTTNTFTQITNTTTYPNGGNISEDGNHIAFVSGADITGGNPTHGQKLFLC